MALSSSSHAICVHRAAFPLVAATRQYWYQQHRFHQLLLASRNTRSTATKPISARPKTASCVVPCRVLDMQPIHQVLPCERGVVATDATNQAGNKASNRYAHPESNENASALFRAEEGGVGVPCCGCGVGGGFSFAKWGHLLLLPSMHSSYPQIDDCFCLGPFMLLAPDALGRFIGAFLLNDISRNADVAVMISY